MGLKRSSGDLHQDTQVTTGRVCNRTWDGTLQVADHYVDQCLKTYGLRHGFKNAARPQARLPDVKGTRVFRQNNHNRLIDFT